MRIIMRVNRFGTPDGARPLRYNAGEMYEVPLRLAQHFLQMGYGLKFKTTPPTTKEIAMGIANRLVQRTAQPNLEPVTVTEAKNFLRIDGTVEDALIGDMIKAARIGAEQQTGLSFITQSWTLAYDDCPPPYVSLPHGPVQSIVEVRSIDEAEQSTTIAASSYHLSADKEQLNFESIPSGHRVEIEYVTGFGSAAADVPADIKHALLIHVAWLYEHRDSIEPPAASALIYNAYRTIRL